MCYFCDHPGATREDYEREVRAIIDRYGVFICHVEGSAWHQAAEFSYTVGLHESGHPELLLVGCDFATAQLALNWVTREIIWRGYALEPGERFKIKPWGRRVAAELVPNCEQIAFDANSFYRRPDGDPVGLLQLTYTDAHGHFPWEPGYSLPAWKQPRPGEFSAMA